MLQKLLDFIAAEAWEQRARDRERRRLVVELEGICADSRYHAARLPVLTAQLEKLKRADSDAALAAGRRACYDGLQKWATRPRTNPTISAMLEDDACLGGEARP